MKRLEVKNFGPIREADIEFGDLTVFVGPQATGKSLLLQLFKAVTDAGAIRSDLKSYGFDWLHGTDLTGDYCSLYFGGGLENLVHHRTSLRYDGKPLAFQQIAKPPARASAAETAFLIPAQRVLVLQDGWPKPFMGYSSGDPYSMRRFSDSLRILMEKYFGTGAAIFPHARWLRSELKAVVDESIYIGAKLTFETEGMRKRIMLVPQENAPALPYNAWSAGQREFTPLLLALYWLMPPARILRRGDLRTVMIEEPEMGLHPQAIVSFGLLVLELMHRDYRVIVSTHSPVILDLVWALGRLKTGRPRRSSNALANIFRVLKGDRHTQRIFVDALGKTYRTYFFDRTPTGVVTKDISSLDPGDEDPIISGWGGLSGLSGRIADIVGEALTDGGA